MEWAACLRSDRPVLAFSRGVGIHFLAPHHEIHEPLPIFEKPVSGHRLKVLEKLLAPSGRGANHLAARIGHFQKRVQTEWQQVHGQQQGGELFFAVARQRLADVIITKLQLCNDCDKQVICSACSQSRSQPQLPAPFRRHPSSHNENCCNC